jgi:hypothetical protein
LGKLLVALQGFEFDFDPASYGFLFDKLIGARGKLITLPSGRKK